MRKFLFVALTLVLGLTLVACKDPVVKEVEHEVKFYVEETLHKTLTVKDGEKIDFTLVTKPVQEGKEFKFWADNGVEFVVETEIKKDYELKAVFEDIPVELTLADFIEASFADNNYKSNTELYYYDDLKESVEMKFAGSISSYQDSNVHEIYVTNKSKINVYQKQGENWKKLADKTVEEGYNIFDYVKEEDFNKSGNKYTLKGDRYMAFDVYFGLEIELEFGLKTLEIVIEDGKVVALNYSIDIDRLTHNVKMNFSNYGTIILEVPTV